MRRPSEPARAEWSVYEERSNAGRLAATEDMMLIDAEIVELEPPIGLGVATRTLVESGAFIAVFGGEIMSAAAFDNLNDETRSRSIQVDDDEFLVPGDVTNPAALVNHSCDPNCRLVGGTSIVAARDIEPGELLTYDYATSDSTPYDEFDCHCGSERCRVHVSGSDWSNPELQQQYEGWFSPYLERKINAMRDSREAWSGADVAMARRHSGDIEPMTG